MVSLKNTLSLQKRVLVRETAPLKNSPSPREGAGGRRGEGGAQGQVR